MSTMFSLNSSSIKSSSGIITHRGDPIAFRFSMPNTTDLIMHFAFPAELLDHIGNVELLGEDDSIMTVNDLFDLASSSEFLSEKVIKDQISWGTKGEFHEQKKDTWEYT